MTVDEVKILLSDLNRGYNTPYSSAEQATIERLYYEVLGKHLNGCRCPDKWHDAVLEINSYIKKHGKMKEKSNYNLRAGVILQIAGSSEIYTNDNLTDEVAAAFLKEHPNAAGRFEVIPTAEKDAEAPKAGGESSELEAAHNRIAILESEKVELESRCAALQARIDAAAATETAATDDEKPGSDDTGAESADEADERPAGNNGNTADDAIRQAIAAELVAGHERVGHGAPLAAGGVDVGVADARVGDVEVDLPLAGFANVDLQGVELGGGIVTAVGDHAGHENSFVRSIRLLQAYSTNKNPGA